MVGKLLQLTRVAAAGRCAWDDDGGEMVGYAVGPEIGISVSTEVRVLREEVRITLS